MPDINLLQTESHDIGSEVSKAARVVARVLLLLVIAVIAIYAYLFFSAWRNQSNLTKVTADIELKQAQSLANDDRNELVTRQEQLKQLETLIDDHVYWSYLMPELARVTLKSGRFTKIEAKNDGKLSLTVNMASYEDIEKFMQIFDLPEYNQQFSNVRIVSITKTQNESSIETQVTVELTFNPEFIKGKM